jgi:tetratricopeptide (TPR) repeat protein
LGVRHSPSLPQLVGRGAMSRRIDIGVALAMLLILIFAPAAQLTTTRSENALGTLVEEQPSGPAAGPRVRLLPVDIPPGLTIRRPADIERIARTALGERPTKSLLRLLNDEIVDLPETAVVTRTGENQQPIYPYRYPLMERLLDGSIGRGRTRDAAALGASLIVLAGQSESGLDNRFRNAAPAAFAVLNRARDEGGCSASLNLLFLLAASEPNDDLVRREAARAEAACPGDPTPGWLLGLFQSLRALVFVGEEEKATWEEELWPADRMERAGETFARLQKMFPISGDLWAGDGDQHVRAGFELQATQPFAARARFQQALAAYHQARQRGPNEVTVIGEALAYIGLGEAVRAADLLKERGTTEGGRRAALALLIVAQESIGDFGAARDTAQQLASVGAQTVSDSQAFLPYQRAPYNHPLERLGAQGALMTSLGDVALLSVQLQPGAGRGGGAAVVDWSFIPRFRDDGTDLASSVTGSYPFCPDFVWRRDALLAHDPVAGLQAYPKSFRDLRPEGFVDECDVDADEFRRILLVEAGLPTPDAAELFDARQNLWRWAGDLNKALEVIDDWNRRSRETDILPRLRRGEVLYLQRSFDDSAAAFGEAARLAEDGFVINLARNEALLRRGAALLAAGRSSEAVPTLRRVADEASVSISWFAKAEDSIENSESLQRAVLSFYYAHSQLADHERITGQPRAAQEDYSAALSQVSHLLMPPGVRPEAVHNSAALTYLSIGRFDAAEREVRAALAADPENPAFLMTGGLVADRAGQVSLAAERNAHALSSDPGAFSAANDLAVQLVQLGRSKEAVDALRRAVSVKPDFALGWFNLGVLYEDLGRVLASQGAFARAVRLDPGLKDHPQVLTIDTRVYETGLDISKPLPPRWSLANLDRRTPSAAAGLLAVLVVAAGLARAIGPAGGRNARKWLELSARRLHGLPVLRRIRHPAWAITATIAAFMLPIALRPRTGWASIVMYGIGLLILSAVAVRARAVVARQQRVRIAQRSWPPGLCFGLLGGAFGAPWAPLPTVLSKPASNRVYEAAPLVLGVLAAALFLEAAWLSVPLTHDWAVAALIMAASTLLPVKPLDGGRLSGGATAAALGLVGAAVLVVIGVL